MDNGFTCPKCGSDCKPGLTSLDGWDDDLYNGYVFVDVTCPVCKTEYTNTYSLESSVITYSEEDE